MADTKSANGTTNGIHAPRARKVAPNSPAARALGNDLKRPALNLNSPTPSGTPAPPDDAPPSVKATSAARRELRRKSNRRMFPTVDYQSRVSYFDPRSEYSNFRGFFVLFWIGLAIMVITSMLRNLRETGKIMEIRQWPLFVENIWELAASDVLMVASTAINLPLHWLYKRSKGWLRWNRGGMIVQSLVQIAWGWIWIGWPFARDWTWTAQVFFTLHTLALLMKMHSYAFYCGHLSTTFNRLRQLDLPLRPGTPTTKAVRYPRTHLQEVKPASTSNSNSDSDSDVPPIVQLRQDLALELTSPQGDISYPANLTLANYIDYLLCPTLCYELSYPRTPSRNYMELFYKILAVFGCIFLMTVVSEEFILPVLAESHDRLSSPEIKLSLYDSALIFAETVSRLLFPFMLTFLLTFLVIFEYTLNAFAEITRFADRQFYSDWWNSLDWLEFSREWNIPVHNFFRRHVYSSSRLSGVNKVGATSLTFFVSALAHELVGHTLPLLLWPFSLTLCLLLQVMGCITRKFRGYGFMMMMLQGPIVLIQRTSFVRKKTLLNNVMFWCSMIMGLALLCALYVLV